ncbi:MAG: FkbM family methyltransferase [Hyphomicrobiaceae bacterium]|nr:FkbM family methyltransferase [Hyphomicrobiaceae bacterium]
MQVRRRLVSSVVSGLVALIGVSRRGRNEALRGLLDRHLARGTLCLVPFDDHALYVDPRDDKIALKLLAGRPWQRRELEGAIAMLRDTGSLRPGGVFVDIGANIGTQTTYAMASGAFAHAVAIEPDPHNFAILKRNIALNGLEGRVTVIAAAASSAAGPLTLRRHRKNYGAHSVEDRLAARRGEAVRVAGVTVDGALEELAIAPGRVALVKIDVEGHELAVLEGAGALRAAHVPMLVEVTAEGREDPRFAELKSMLLSHYCRVADVRGTAPPKPLCDLAWQAHQADLLVF